MSPIIALGPHSESWSGCFQVYPAPSSLSVDDTTHAFIVIQVNRIACYLIYYTDQLSAEAGNTTSLTLHSLKTTLAAPRACPCCVPVYTISKASFHPLGTYLMNAFFRVLWKTNLISCRDTLRCGSFPACLVGLSSLYLTRQACHAITGGLDHF
jgi:hypothetical protein